MINYPYVLAVCEAGSQDIIHFITAENTTYGTAAFCAFDQNGGHLNFGPWPVDASKQQFIERATEMAEEVFHLPPKIEVIEAAPRKKFARNNTHVIDFVTKQGGFSGYGLQGFV